MSKIMDLADAYADADSIETLSCINDKEDVFADALRKRQHARAALKAEVECLESRLADYDKRLSEVMPPDFKDWHENNPAEWPEIAAMVIANLRELEELNQQLCEQNDAVGKACAELEAERDSLRKIAAGESKRQLELRSALRAEIAELREDAERYRWLRDQNHMELRYRPRNRKKLFAVCNPLGNYEYEYHPTLDAAIDAARGIK